MNNKLRLSLFALAVLLVLSGAYLFYKNKANAPTVSPIPSPVPPSASAFDPLNATYVVENRSIKLTGGRAEEKGTEGTSSRTITEIFGEPVIGDLNGDGRADAAFFVTQSSGGSGTFFYAAVAINTASGTEGTNAVFLGDRIAPDNIRIKDGRAVANYAERKPGEPFTVQPSVGVSAYLALDSDVLKRTDAPVRTISYLVSPEDPTKYCNGADMDSAGFRKTITKEMSTSTKEADPSLSQLAAETIKAATTGTCREALGQVGIKVSNGVATIPPIEGWAGVSIALCSCKPLVEANLLRIPGISKVDWSSVAANFEECVAGGNPVTKSNPRQCQQGEQTFTENVGNGINKADQIKLESPLPNQAVKSPLSIKGQARGSWFFEASFPVVLVDWDGKIIAQGQAKAKGDWMTTEFVPFEATLDFTIAKDVYSNKGALILKKDNPSGLPANDDSLEIPILYADSGTASGGTVCTQEAKLCPDGSYVGRSGPDCAFAACPSTPK